MDSKNLPITGPCPIDLDAIGFDRSSKRSHCGHCEKSVHVLSNMTEREARGFMTENAGKNLCVSYARTKDGTVVFKPEAAPQVVPLARLSRRSAAAATGLGLAIALAACTPHSDTTQTAGKVEQVEQVEQVEGGLEMREPCDTPKTPEAKKHEPTDEMMEGEMVMPEPEPIPVAGGMLVPEPPPETDMVDGAMEIPPPEPEVKPEPEPESDAGQMHARGNRQVLHFDDE
jgi:hypothetical protein